MSNLTVLHNDLTSLGAFSGELPKLFEELIEVNYFNIPYRMKAVIALSEVTTLASQFQRNIKLPDGTLVPVNSICFCIASSGANKDSSLRITRKVFEASHAAVRTVREDLAINSAIDKAQAAGEECPEDEGVYKEYYIPPVATFLKDVTPQGLIQYLNDISKEGLGAGLITNSEVADELQNNMHFPDIIKIISECYDLGIVEAGYTKTAELRNAGVSGVAFNALLIGSFYTIMFNEQLKTRFINNFISKLARRGNFAYIPEVTEAEEITSGLEQIAILKEQRAAAKQTSAALSYKVEEVTQFGVDTVGQDLPLSEKADTIFLLLQLYDESLANETCGGDTAKSLSTKHRYWRALKLAGALAIFDRSDEITEAHMIHAISITSLFAKDMGSFEKDLSKAPYERLDAYMVALATSEEGSTISAHEIKKRGFSTSVTPAKLKELVALCSSCNEEGIYTLINENTAISYSPIIKTSTLSISYKPINTTNLNQAVLTGNKESITKAKQSIAASTSYGFESGETTFAELSDLLQEDFAYSPFKFKDGTRGKDNIVGGTKWLVFDIDDSVLRADELHVLLMDINHHIALSSDNSNKMKFRLLIELDSVVELNAVTWKYFCAAVSEELAIKVDPLPQSQVFFSYKGRDVYSQLDAEPLGVRNYVLYAIEKEASKPSTVVTKSQAKALLSDPLNEFAYLFEAQVGQGSRAMIRAAYHAKDLGSSLEDVQTLLTNANEYWFSPMEEERFSKVLLQVSNMFN